MFVQQIYANATNDPNLKRSMPMKYTRMISPNIPAKFKNHPILWLVISNIGKLAVYDVAVVYVNYLFGTYQFMNTALVFGFVYFVFRLRREILSVR